MGNCKKCSLKTRLLSRKGYCDLCSDVIRKLVVIQINARKGPYYDKWKLGILKSLEDKQSNAKPKLKVKKKRSKLIVKKPRPIRM